MSVIFVLTGALGGRPSGGEGRADREAQAKAREPEGPAGRAAVLLDIFLVEEKYLVPEG